MYQLFVKIGLIFTMLWQACFGAFMPVLQKTVKENGSLGAVDALGRSVVSAGESKKLVGIFYFLFNGDGGDNGPYDVTKIIKTTRRRIRPANVGKRRAAARSLPPTTGANRCSATISRRINGCCPATVRC